MLNYPKKQYYHTKKEVPIDKLEKTKGKAFILDLKPLDINKDTQVLNKKKEKKLESPKKKTFKEEEPLVIMKEMNEKVAACMPINPKSPRLKIPRNSISYDGEFSIKLQHFAEKVNAEEKVIFNSFLIF